MSSDGQAWSRERDGTGHVLAYADDESAPLVAALTATHAQSGIVVRGSRAAAAIRALPTQLRRQPVVIDVAAWTNEEATPDAPLHLSAPGGMFPIDLDAWALAIAPAHLGVSAILTPSRFVVAGDFPSMRAVCTASALSQRPDVVTLVATDAEMLSRRYRAAFLRILDEHAGLRPLAFAFASKNTPFGTRERAEGLRELLRAHPGSLLIATDALAGCDAAAHGVSAAVGVTGGLRRPCPPGTQSGCNHAQGFVPGLFLRDLWEFRSPSVYADWYANSRSPSCAACGGRALDRFTSHPADKQAVLLHNVHTLLAVLDEIAKRAPIAAQAWLDGDRRRALAAHLTLHPGSGLLKADPLLRWLCEMDDLQGRRTTPKGEWI